LLVINTAGGIQARFFGRYHINLATMLSEKETNKVTLSAVRKTNARVIMLKKPGDSKDKKKEVTKKDSKNLLPH